MKKQHRSQLKLLSLLLTLAMLLLSSCNTSPPESEKTATTQSSTEEDGFFFEVIEVQLAGCFSESEYLAFLNSEQCPSNFYVSLNAFEDFGSLERFSLHRNKVTEIMTGQYHFERDGKKTAVWVEIGEELTDLEENPFYEAISDENMPENFVLGKSINEYWGDVLMAEIEAGKIEDPFNGPEPYNHMRGNYYPITEKVSVVYESDELYSLFNYFSYYGPVIHLSMNETTQIWIAPYNRKIEMTTTKLYELFREVSPLMDCLLTKSTSKAAAEELYNLWKDALK